MPTFETLTHFDREYAKLTIEQQKAFREAALMFVADLRSRQGFRRGLRVKRVQGSADVWELT